VNRPKVFLILVVVIPLLASIYFSVSIPTKPESRRNLNNSFQTPIGESAKPGHFYLSGDKSTLTLIVRIEKVSISDNQVALGASVYPQNSKNKTGFKIVAFDENSPEPLVLIEQATTDMFPTSKDYTLSRINDSKTAYAKLSRLDSKPVSILLNVERFPVNESSSPVDKDGLKDLDKYLDCNRRVKSLLAGDIARLDCLSRIYQVRFIQDQRPK